MQTAETIAFAQVFSSTNGHGINVRWVFKWSAHDPLNISASTASSTKKIRLLSKTMGVQNASPSCLLQWTDQPQNWENPLGVGPSGRWALKVMEGCRSIALQWWVPGASKWKAPIPVDCHHDHGHHYVGLPIMIIIKKSNVQWYEQCITLSSSCIYVLMLW